MNIKKHLRFILLSIFLPVSLFSQADKVIVTVEKANIYAEPSSGSYRIDAASRGTQLTLIQKTKVNDSWYYVRFQSRRYGGQAMGFVRDTEVEPFTGEKKESQPPPLPQSEKKPPPESQIKPAPEKKPPEIEKIAEQEKPPLEPEVIKKTQPAGPPAKTAPALSTTAFSDKITLSKRTDSFDVRLDFLPFSSFRSFEIPDPTRLVVDFQDVSESAGFHRYAVNDLGIAAIRVAMFQENIARVVFDFKQDIPAYQIEQTETGVKILFLPAEPIQPQKVETETMPIQPPRKEIKPEPEPVISTEEVLQTTAIPFSSRLSLPLYTLPSQEAFWELIRTEPMMAEPKPKAKPLEIPPPQAELETDKRKETVKPPPEQIKPPMQAPYIRPRVTLPARLSLGLGYGSSTGGFGGFVQYSVIPNLALHGGVGYFPTSLIYSETDWVENQVLYSVGLKYYIPIVSQSVRGYLNVQYGGFTVEAVQLIEGIWDGEFIYRNEQKALYGPQALLGGEFHLGPLKLNASAGAAYALTDWEWLPQDFYFTFDLGLLFYLK